MQTLKPTYHRWGMRAVALLAFAASTAATATPGLATLLRASEFDAVLENGAVPGCEGRAGAIGADCTESVYAAVISDLRRADAPVSGDTAIALQRLADGGHCRSQAVRYAQARLHAASGRPPLSTLPGLADAVSRCHAGLEAFIRAFVEFSRPGRADADTAYREILKQASAQGSVSATEWLVEVYSEAGSSALRSGPARHYLELAHSQGSARAAAALADLHHPDDLPRARRYAGEACGKGVVESCVYLAVHQLHGVGTEQDVDAALAELSRYADRSSRAALWIGHHHLLSGTSPDRFARAGEGFRRAMAIDGSALAAYYLGHMHLEGLGVARDETEALRLFRIAHAAGVKNAGAFIEWIESGGEGAAPGIDEPGESAGVSQVEARRPSGDGSGQRRRANRRAEE